MALLHEIIKTNAYFALERVYYSQVHKRVLSQSLVLSNITTGLYISKAIVKAHNGKISAFNNSEGGATFVISLPIKQER
jgi:K+-sensing histidine kinase KdpD